MLDPPQQNSARPLISITPRKKSVRFNITTPSPRTTSDEKSHRQHPLNVSYTIPSTTINIDHVTNQSHLQHLNNRVEYVPTTRRNHLQIQGEKIPPPPPQTYDELQQFMKIKAENLRKNMSKVATTFNHASTHLNRLKEEQQTVLKRPSRIPISTRHRSPSPPVVIYKKAQQRSITELRWLCLARKYSLLWQKRIFHCHLRRIKQYSEQKLLKKYFLLWKTHPYEQIALQFYHQNLLKTYFHQWIYSNSQIQLAIEFLNHQRIKTTWNLWKNQLSKRRLHQRQYRIANEQYHRKILSHFYFIWKTNTNERQEFFEKHLRATYHRRICLQRICFNAWLTYIDYRRKKNLHKKRVYEYAQRHLIERIYSNWKQALTRKLTLRQNEFHLNQLQKRILLRWAFEQWKSYMESLVDEQQTMKMAEQYSHRRILRRALTNLRQYVAKRRMKQRLNWIALQHRARTIERVYFIEWKTRLEERENIFMFNEFRKADSFYHMKITIRYWFAWRRYINNCRQENAQIKLAENYYHSKIVRKYFSLLRSNITNEQHEQYLEKQADQHYRLRYLQLYYTYWKVQTRIREQYQINFRIAIVHEETRMKQRIFNIWLDRAHSKLIDNEQHIVAERHYLRTLVTHAWLAWRQFIDEQHNHERLEKIAIQFYYHTIQRRTIHAWKIYIRHCQYMKQMYHQSQQFYLQNRGKTLFFKWLFKARDRRRLMSIVNERFNRYQRTNLKYYFRQWRETINEDKIDRQLNSYALDHYHRCLKRKILLHWNNEMIQQVLIDNENQMKLNHYLENQHRILIENIYRTWKEKTNRYLKQRFLVQRAKEFYERKLLKNSFSIWKEESQFNLRIKLLERQAIWFDRMRCVSRVYLQWKTNWQIEQKFHEQKQRALIFWAIQLQKKVFVNWLIYVSERKRKKLRYNQATQLRYDQLVRNCLRQFLIYTDHTKQRRQALFIHQQVYLYHDRNALASKYVAKWRDFVKRSTTRKNDHLILIKKPIKPNPINLVRFDSSPPKITNRPRPRKPAFLSGSYSTTVIDQISEPSIPPIRTPPSSPPKIDHSLHSPFISVKQKESHPVLLPPSAFQIHSNEIQMPLSSRIHQQQKTSLPHRSYSTQPIRTNQFLNKDNLLDVKQRLEIYLNTKTKLKQLRQQLAKLSPLQTDPQLEEQCQQLTAFINSEKLHLSNILQNL